MQRQMRFLRPLQRGGTELKCAQARPLTAQQFVKDNAERVNIASRRGRIPSHLLRTRISGSKHAEANHRRLFARARKVANDFGDAKIQQLGGSVLLDENIARLQIAMDYVSLMRITNSSADFEK